MADKYDLLTYSELAIMTEHETDDQFRTAAEFLLNAVEDWPVYNQQQTIEFVSSLKEEVKAELNYENLKQYLAQLSLQGDGWRIASVNSLLEMFDFNRKNHFNNSINLEEIISQLTKRCRKLQ